MSREKPARGRDEEIARLRPLMARMFHGLWPGVALVDCARAANSVMDRIAEGDRELMVGARDFCAVILKSSDEQHLKGH